jgi:eukaryotic-like serine/threonine-protein kinase
MSEASLSSSAGPRPSLDRRMDRVCTDFEVALRDGGQPRIEDFLGDRERPDHPELLVELVMLEALYRRGRGEPPAAEEYAVRFPAEATLIRSALAQEFPDTPSPSVGGAGVTEVQPLPADASPANGDAREATVGDRIGPYKLRQQIGEGGMGTVWMAEQTEPVRRSVALKLVKAGMDSRHVIARFESERQALAIMDHANIAKIHDAGTTASGRPYFVMELVKGVPITEFCDKNRLSPEDRLKLFLDVCHAIQHAHHKGIIHRDIKPSNVLVTLCDGAPVVKVIDFGIAKALAQKLTESTLFTAFGQMIGTPAYMSPEQAEMTGLDIDTRSDVYSLGVLLYELLTGTTPLESKRLREMGYGEMQRLIREEEAPRPSTRVSTLGDSAATLAVNRGTDAKRLSHLLSGDLDWIVMKALDKDRNRRYATPERFAEDVERYLRHDVVLARPPSTAYRLRRFAQRNRAAVLTATAVAAALLVGTAVAMWQAVRATHAKNEAEARAAETKAVLNYVETQVFAAPRPKGQAGGLGHDITLRQALEAALPSIDSRFKNQPLIEARLRMTLGMSFLYLGDAKIAAEQIEIARAICLDQRGPDHPDTLNCMNNLANCYFVLSRLPEALKLYEETLSVRKAIFPANHPATLMSMNNLANCYAANGQIFEARDLFAETLALQKACLSPNDPDTLLSMNNLARCDNALGRYAAARDQFAETLKLRIAILPPEHPDTLVTRAGLADSYAGLGRHADALEMNLKTLEFQKKDPGPVHSDTLATMNNIALNYAALGLLGDALKLHKETLKLRQDNLGLDNLDTLWSMSNLADTYADLKQYAEGLMLFAQALELQKNKIGADHPDTLWTAGGVARCLVMLNRGAEAVPIIDECCQRAAGKVVDPRLFPRLVTHRLRHFEKTKDAVGCQQTAAMWEKLNRTDADSLYLAACFRAVTAGVFRQRPEAGATGLANDEADRAMQWLRQAIAAGYADVPVLLNDTGFSDLRGRADYADLLWDLADTPAPVKP